MAAGIHTTYTETVHKSTFALAGHAVPSSALPRLAADFWRSRNFSALTERPRPPAIWTGPAEPHYQRPRRVTVPCLFVALALGVFVTLVAIGVYRVFEFIVNY